MKIIKTKNLKVHKLALYYIENSINVDCTIFNNILKYIGCSISQDNLDKLMNLPKIHFENLNTETLHSKEFLNYVGEVKGKKKVSGVYIFTCKSDGSKYVGSSSQLYQRLAGYLKNTHRVTGKFLPILYNEGIEKFSLDVIIVENGMQFILEQYYLLHKEYNLNTLKLVNSIYGTKSKPLYLYTKDSNTLIYYSEVQEDFIYKLGIHYTTFTNCLKTGKAYLNKYTFTNKPLNNVNIVSMSINEIKIMLENDRKKVNNRNVSITNVNDGKVLYFESIKDCVYYLNKIQPANKTTLYRRINSKKEYNGYICRFENN